jgi:hypothetical protein
LADPASLTCEAFFSGFARKADLTNDVVSMLKKWG